MKIKISLILCFLFSVLIVLSMGRRDDTKPISYFQDKETFIIIAKGKPIAGEKDVLKRQVEAEKAAVMVAQFEMTIKLRGFKILEQKISKTQHDRKQTCTLTYIVKVEKE